MTRCHYGKNPGQRLTHTGSSLPHNPETRKNRGPYRGIHGFVMVGEGGLEPPRPEGHWHLKPARLPFRHSPECFWPLSDLFKIAHSRSIASNTLITAYFHPSSCAVYPPLPPTCRDTSPAAPNTLCLTPTNHPPNPRRRCDLKRHLNVYLEA